MAAPRDVNVIMRDYHFDPTPLYLYPGETVRLNVFNGGMVEHELVLGDAAVQAAGRRRTPRRRRPRLSPRRHRPASIPSVGGLRIFLAVGRSASVIYHVPSSGHLADDVPLARPPGAGHGRRRRARALAKIGLQSPTQSLAQHQERTRMTYVIAEPCIDVIDQSCVAVCPVDCIHFDSGTDRMLFIDPDECIDCGACEPECPVNAIYPEDSLPAEWAQLHRASTRRWFKDKDAARATIDEWKAPA